MENKTGNEKSLRRRFLAVAVAIVVAFSAICFQLMQLQLRDGSQYAQAAQDKVVTSTVLKGDRGMILDRNGIVLATSVEATTIYANPVEDRCGGRGGVSGLGARGRCGRLPRASVHSFHHLRLHQAPSRRGSGR